MATNADKIDFTRTVYEIRKHWYYYLVSAVLVLGVATLYMCRKNPVYAFHANVLIEPKEGGVSGGGMMQIAKAFSMGSFGGGSVDDELLVFQSHGLMRELVSELKLNVTYSEKEGIRKLSLYKKSPVELVAPQELFDTLSDGKTFKIFLRKDGLADITVIEGMFTSVYEREGVKLPADVKLPDGTFRLVQTEHFVPGKEQNLRIRVKTMLKATEDYSLLFSAYVPSLKANGIQLDYEDFDIRRGKDVLNTMLALYEKRKLTEDRMQTDEEIAFIDGRLSLLTEQLEASDRKLEEFKTANDITNLEAEAKVLLEQTSANKSSIVGLQTQLAIFDMICEFLDDPKNKYAMIPVTSGVEYESAAKSIESYNQLVLERMQLDMSAKSDNKALVALNKQIDGMRKGVVTTMQKARESAEIAYRDFVVEDGKYAARLRQLPAHERKFMDLFRDRGVKNSLYIFLLEQRESKALKLGAASSAGRVVDCAYYESKKIAPKGSVVFGAALILTLLLPTLLLMFKALRVKRVEIFRDVEGKTALPVIAEFSGSGQQDTEALRRLRNLIMGKGAKRVLITSSSAEADRAGLAYRLASSLAVLRKSVVLALTENGPAMPETAGVRIAALHKEGVLPSELLVLPETVAELEKLSAENDYTVVCAPEIAPELCLDAVTDVVDMLVVEVCQGEKTGDLLGSLATVASLKEKTAIVFVKK